MRKKNWTIGFVNYKTYIYMEYQLRTLYEFNDYKSFQIIIIDNSVCKEEKKSLQRLVKKYSSYNNIELVFHNPKEISASGQHGEGLSIIQNKCSTKFLLAQDPDFFWIEQNHLLFLEKILDQGYIAVGAPYDTPIGIGKSDFPSSFGCAYKLDSLKGTDFTAKTDEHSINESRKRFPKMAFSYDVGWKIRQKLSNRSYLSFDFYPLGLFKNFKYSFECLTHLYSLNQKPVAIHLFRGSFTGYVSSEHADPKKGLNSQWMENRKKISEYIFNILETGKIPVTPLCLKLQGLTRLLKKKLLYMSMVFKLVTFLRKSKFGRKIIRVAKKVILGV